MAHPNDDPLKKDSQADDSQVDDLIRRSGAAWPTSDEELDRWLQAQSLEPDERRWIEDVVRRRIDGARRGLETARRGLDEPRAPSAPPAAAPVPAASASAPGLPLARPRGVSRLSADDLARLDRQLLELVQSGIPLPLGLATYGAELASGRLGRVLDALRQDLEAGLPLSEAIQRRGAALPRIYGALVAAGEASGDLEGILAILARQSDRDAEIGRRLREALAPAAVALGATSVLAFTLFSTVVPEFDGILRSMNLELPALTETVLDVSLFTRAHPFVIGIGGIAAAVAFVRVLAPWVQGRLPGLLDGRLRARTLSELSRSLAGFLSRGMPAATAFRALEVAYEGSFPKGTLARVAQRLDGGETVAAALRPEPSFPPTFVWFVGAAEGQGNLASMLDDLAADYERRYETHVRRFEAWLVPLGMAFVGLFVGTVVLSLFLPIFKLQSSLQQ